MSQYPPTSEPYPAQPAPYGAAPVADRSRPMAMAGVAMAVLVVIAEIASLALLHAALGAGRPASEAAVGSGFIGLITLVLAVAALVFGILGLTRPGTGKGVAGVAVGVGAEVILMGIVTIALPMMFQ